MLGWFVMAFKLLLTKQDGNTLWKVYEVEEVKGLRVPKIAWRYNRQSRELTGELQGTYRGVAGDSGRIVFV
jgi:hypothetical protein